MDLAENATSESADAFVALIQKQMKRLSEELGEGQEIEAIVPLASGGPIRVMSFGYHNPDLVKISGIDADGNDVCLLAHKNTLQVVLKRVGAQASAKPQVAFQLPQEEPAPELTIDETA